ncbi:hypothetical protein GCM10023340_32220 [Nocardioides marinquilinus]|uniref:Uncharacterized protein n=1 Tax=Nocardioides marinquilinus TaxID=1210400 RepID=A0ABP9PUA2_9ACTN
MSLLLALPAVASAQALDEPGSSTVVASGADQRGDVRITGERGLGRADRRTVDIERLTLTEVGDRDLEVTWRVRRVVTPRDAFDQYYFVYLLGPDGPPYGFATVHASGLRAEAGLEGAGRPQGFASCPRLRAEVGRHGTEMSLTIPRRCVPRARIEASAFVYTTPLGRGGGGRLFSRDRARIRGLVDLRPTG